MGDVERFGRVHDLCRGFFYIPEKQNNLNASIMSTESNSVGKIPERGIDKLIYDILAHGQRQRIEILRLASKTRFSEQSIDDNLRDAVDKYDWACKVRDEDNDEVYYHREDVGKESQPPSSPAKYDDVDKLLRQCELQLGIKSRNDEDLPTEESAVMTDSLNRLNDISRHHGKVFKSNEFVERFFEIVDEILKATEEAYATDYPQIPGYTTETYRLMFMLIASRYEKWQEGAAHVNFNIYVRERFDKLEELSGVVPPEIGSAIFSIVIGVDIEESRSVFKNMAQSNQYDVDELYDYAKLPYLKFNDANVLLQDIARWRGQCECTETQKLLRELDGKIRSKYIDSDS